MYIIWTVKREFGFFQESAPYILDPSFGMKRVLANRLGSQGERPARAGAGQMPKAACLILLFVFLSAVRSEIHAVIEVPKEFMTVHPGVPPAQITPSNEGDRRRRGITFELPFGYERWHRERDTTGSKRGSWDYVTDSTIGTRSGNAVAAPAPAAPVLAEVLGRRGADKGPFCRRPPTFNGRLLAGEAQGDSSQLSERNNANREEPGGGMGIAGGGGGGRARDPGATMRVAAVLSQVPLHSTVMYVTNQGAFVRRHIPARSRALMTTDASEAQGVNVGGGGSANSTPAGGEGGCDPRATGATATATATASDGAKIGGRGTARRWFTGQWARLAGQFVRPSAQLKASAGPEAGGSDDGRDARRSCSRGSDGTAGGGCVVSDEDIINGGGIRRRRQLAQQQMQQDSAVDSASVTFNPRLACEGCPPGDPRVRVLQPREPPFAAVGLLAQEQRRLLSGSVSQCTATLIGPRHLITAAHCVVAPDRWSFIEQVRWFPQLDTAEPNTEVRSLPVRTIRVLERYIRLGSASLAALNYDFALLTLDQALTPKTFTLSIAPGQGQAVMDLETAGYPGDKPRGTMWTVRCPRVKFNFEGTELEGCGEGCENMVIHDCVSWEGQSGSAMWETAVLSGSTTETSPPPVSPPSPLWPSPTVRAPEPDANRSIGNNTIRAILTGVIKFDDGTTYNVGTELNDFVYGTIATWYNEDVQASEAQLEVPPGYQGGSPAAKINTDTPRGGDSGETSRSWIGDHIFVPVLVGGGALLLLSLLVALCALPFRLNIRRRVL